MPKSKMKNSRFAGELLVAAELTRLGLSVAMHNTFGTNTQDFDLSVANADGDSVQVQVKSLKGPNAFLIDPENIKAKVVYVFVIVGEPGTLPKFFVARGEELLRREKELFGKWGREYPKKHGRGVQSSRMPKECLNAWNAMGLGDVA
jgi:hypothetical protein